MPPDEVTRDEARDNSGAKLDKTEKEEKLL